MQTKGQTGCSRLFLYVMENTFTESFFKNGKFKNGKFFYFAL